MHILSPETDNCPSWISSRERMTVENISWSISTKECCWPRRGLNPRPPSLQSDSASNWATEACYEGRRKSSYFSYFSNKTYVVGFHLKLPLTCFQGNKKNFNIFYSKEKDPYLKLAPYKELGDNMCEKKLLRAVLMSTMGIIRKHGVTSSLYIRVINSYRYKSMTDATNYIEYRLKGSSSLFWGTIVYFITCNVSKTNYKTIMFCYFLICFRNKFKIY